MDHRGDDAEETEQQHDLLRNLREVETRLGTFDQQGDDVVEHGNVERGSGKRPTVRCVGDRFGVERYELRDERERERSQREAHCAKSAKRKRDERPQRRGNDSGDQRAPEKVQPSVRRHERKVDSPVAGQRPTCGEASGGDERRLREAHHAAHSGEHDERQEDQCHAETECDRALLVGIRLQRADVDPLERERQQDHGEDQPRQAASPRGQARAVIGRCGLLRERACPATAFTRGNEEEEQQGEDERDRRAEATELGEELGKELVAVAGQQVLGDPQQEPADESDRYRAKAAERHGRERTEHHQREQHVVQLEERCDEDPTQPGEDHREDPGEPGRSPGVHASEPCELRPVDHRAHLEPGARLADHPPQDGRRRTRRDQHRELVGVDAHACDGVEHLRGYRADPRSAHAGVSRVDRRKVEIRGPCCPTSPPATARARAARPGDRSFPRSARTRVPSRGAAAARSRGRARGVVRTRAPR